MSRLAKGHMRSKWLDMLAIGASAACLVHCLFLPLLFAVLPSVSRLLNLPEGLHLGAFLLAIPASAFAMRTGYRQHGIVHPALLGGLGLVLLGVGALGGMRLLVETGLTVIGSVLLAIAHLRNWRLQSAAFRTRAKAGGLRLPASGDCRCG